MDRNQAAIEGNRKAIEKNREAIMKNTERIGLHDRKLDGVIVKISGYGPRIERLEARCAEGEP